MTHSILSSVPRHGTPGNQLPGQELFLRAQDLQYRYGSRCMKTRHGLQRRNHLQGYAPEGGLDCLVVPDRHHRGIRAGFVITQILGEEPVFQSQKSERK